MTCTCGSQNKLIWFSDVVLLFVVEWRQNNLFSMFLFSYRNIHESLGQLQKALETQWLVFPQHFSFSQTFTHVSIYSLISSVWGSCATTSKIPDLESYKPRGKILKCTYSWSFSDKYSSEAIGHAESERKIE